MSQHLQTEFPNFTKSQMDQGLYLHHLPHDKPSQLSDSFRAGAVWGSENYKNRTADNFNSSVVQEWDGDKSHHRLRNITTGEATAWAPYRAWTYLDGMVGYTAYFFPQEGVLPADQFAKQQAVT